MLTYALLTQATDLSSGTYENPSTLPSRQNSVIIKASNSGAFYQAQKYSGSADSFASASEPPPHDDGHDEEQVTQMETIAGRPSLGKAMGQKIARRLSRARTRSRDVLAVVPGAGVVIGVSVEEATVEAEHDGGQDVVLPGTPQGTTFVFAQAEAVNGRGSGGTRSRRSTVSMPMPSIPMSAGATVTSFGKESPERRLSAAMGSWAKVTKIFRRKSMAVLGQNTQNSSP